MKQNIYVIFDVPANEAGPIMAAKNNDVAVRAFHIALKQADERDFRLYHLGTYDNETLEISTGQPKEISTASKGASE